MSSAAFVPSEASFVQPPAATLAHPASRVVRRESVSGTPSAGLPLRGMSLTGAVLLHAAALLWIAHNPTVLEAPPMIMQATLIAPEPLPIAPPEPPKEEKRVEPEPPKQVVKPVKPVRKEQPLPQIAAAADAPTTTTVAPQPPAPPEPVAIDAPPVAEPSPAPVTAAPVVAPPPVTPPKFNVAYLQNPRPAYPPMSKRLGEAGRVMLRVTVDANGLPTNVEISKSSGFSRLDDAALEAVRKWKFVPARRGDEAISGGQAFVPIDFGLNS
ncbi:energy transducer TonB [Methyloversatilis discipulorum]|uniref:energy transducer TonB n=1 Tax=Methyloversatilis discipulorum TaxID=1119528 RepID=UPI001A48F6B4|nr:energy transducer TonB [Methyloversatilis discipulorum]MBL8469369.1 energy transducer TonB [Methyloversatilis discipulorum]